MVDSYARIRRQFYESRDAHEIGDNLVLRQVSDADANITSLTNEVSGLNSSTTDLQTRVTNNESNLNGINQGLILINTSVNNNSTGVAQNASNIASVVNDVSVVAGNVSSNTNNIASNSNSLVSQDNRITMNANDISDLQTTVAANTTNITTNGGTIGGLSTSVSNLNSNFATLSSSVSINTLGVATNSGQIVSLQGQIPITVWPPASLRNYYLLGVNTTSTGLPVPLTTDLNISETDINSDGAVADFQIVMPTTGSLVVQWHGVGTINSGNILVTVTTTLTGTTSWDDIPNTGGPVSLGGMVTIPSAAGETFCFVRFQAVNGTSRLRNLSIRKYFT